MKERKVRIGKFKHDNIKRGAPTMERFNNWSKEFLNSPELKDYDAYLWGSWPDRNNTKDIDILLSKGSGTGISTDEMEEVSLMNLEKSLVDNNMLVDLGFTDEKVRSFKDNMSVYKDTGKSVPTSGYVYGKEWTVDDRTVKNRMKWKGPFVEELTHNMVKLGGAIPYAKQINDVDNFEKVYGHKPVKIKSRTKIS